MGEGGAPLVLLAAGGTGGHLFPAEALAAALANAPCRRRSRVTDRAPRVRRRDFPPEPFTSSRARPCAAAPCGRWRAPA